MGVFVPVEGADERVTEGREEEGEEVEHYQGDEGSWVLQKYQI